MKNEPVAWTDGNDICPALGYGTRITTEHPKDLGWKPLYTHPHSDKSVKAKTLTDEEIDAIAEEYFKVMRFGLIADTKGFARAILRKAQEK